MNEERLKVLKMLKEGRITMEEAELLLDALGDSGPHSQDETPRDESTSERTRPSGEHGFSGWKGFPRDFLNFDWKLDPQLFQTGFREAMKGFEQSMRDFAGEFQKMDLQGGFKEFFGRSSGQSTKSVNIPATGVRRIILNNRWGDMRINATTAPEITGTASITAWSSDEESAADVADSVEISHYREDDTMVIHCEVPSSYGRTRFRVDLDLNLPVTLALAIKGMSGDLSVSGLEAGVSAVNLSGDIIVQRCCGIIALESKSGDLEILDCGGEIRAHTVSGEVNLEGVRSASVRAHTVSGDIRAEIEPDGDGDIELQSTSGDVRAGLPAEAGLDLTGATTSGEIDCRLAADYSEQTTHRIVGSANGGGSKVNVTTKSGDISFRAL